MQPSGFQAHSNHTHHGTRHISRHSTSQHNYNNYHRCGVMVMGPDSWVRVGPKRAEWTPRVASKITGDYALCSVGLDTRLFIDIKFNDKIVRVIFDPGSCCTYLGKRALDKFPEVQIRSNLRTTAGIIYLNGLVENTTGEAIMIVEISEVSPFSAIVRL